MKQSNTRRPILFYAGLLLTLVLITSVITSGLYARYVATATGSDATRVAKYVFESVDENATALLDISGVECPGDSVTYEFTVTNTDGTAVCEVSQSYTVTVTVDGTMPLSCMLQKNGTVTDSLNTTESSDRTLTLSGELAAGSEEADSYTLTVTWPKEANDASYANGAAIGSVVLALASQQLD